jgi:hypothetical protein
VALAAAVMTAAVVALIRRRGTWRPLAAFALAPLGFLAYWGYLWLRFGRPDAWFWVQRVRWNSRFDWGGYQLTFVRTTLTHHSSVTRTVVAVTVLGSVVLLAALVVQRVPLPLLVYAAAVFASAVTQANYPNSKPRFLLCAFPLVFPIARVLAARWRRTPVRLLTRVLLLALVLTGIWYAGYVLVMAGRAP